MKRKKKELQVIFSFVDRYTGEYLGDNAAEVMSKLPLDRQAQFKLFCREATTGVRHKIVK